MRWRISLILVLALCVAVSCDQQTLEPRSDESALDTPAAKVLYNGVDENQELTFLGCGELNTLYSSDHVVVRETATPKGGYHFGLHLDARDGLIVGHTTGNQYRSNPWAYNVSFNASELPAEYNHETARLVAHGINTDLKMLWKWRIRLKVDKDGQVTKDVFIDEGECR
jgi:hypothetical protein